LPEIQCPVVLVLGAAPHMAGPSESEVALLRNSVRTFVIDSVPGVGHYVFEERPGAVVAAVGRVELAWMVGVLGR
jgi:pimeloyl-ACP methyl ester carboxylesterase